MGRIVLLRHGESQWNLENRFTGWVDVPLSAKGEEEARAAGGKLQSYRFDRAFTSVLMRANETLRIVLEAIGQSEHSDRKGSGAQRAHVRRSAGPE